MSGADLAVAVERPGGERPGRTARGQVRLGWLWVFGPLALLALFVVYPLVTTVQQSFADRMGRPAGLTAWRLVLESGAFWHALRNTVELACAATLCCAVLGTFFAIVLAFVPFPGAGLLTRALTSMLAFPSFFVALSFGVLYRGSGGFLYSFWAVLLAEVTFYTPFVLRPVLAACQQVQVEQLQVAASLGARPARVIGRILLPELLPSVVAGAFTCLLLTLNEFGIVLFIGAKDVLTLPVLVYTDGIVSFDYPSAAVLATVQVVLSLALYLTGRLTVHRLTRTT
jgi:2-aminoethylphosphonate transport system permease protein